MERPTERAHFEQNNISLLGQGGGGRVYEGQYGGIDVAVKMIDVYRIGLKFKAAKKSDYVFLIQFYNILKNLPISIF